MFHWWRYFFIEDNSNNLELVTKGYNLGFRLQSLFGIVRKREILIDAFLSDSMCKDQ